jgi:hypothetical protein
VQQAESVNTAFEAMAQQHSSQWTQEEIHDRLRREIRRLAMRDVPPPGNPVPDSTAPGSLLVSIPQMPIGSLVDSGEGYRSYQINFKTEAAPIQDITLFLERLQRSDQALRVESLELVRQPLANVATANIRVTRTIIDDVVSGGTGEAEETPATALSLLNPGFEEWDSATGQFPGWKTEECSVSQHGAQVTEGQVCLRAQSTGTGGRVFQSTPLAAGRTYELAFDAIAMGPARVEVVDDASGKVYAGGQALTPNGAPYRYRLQFTAAGKPGAPVSIRAPQLVIEGAGSVVLMDNVSLTEAQSGS